MQCTNDPEESATSSTSIISTCVDICVDNQPISNDAEVESNIILRLQEVDGKKAFNSWDPIDIEEHSIDYDTESAVNSEKNGKYSVIVDHSRKVSKGTFHDCSNTNEVLNRVPVNVSAEKSSVDRQIIHQSDDYAVKKSPLIIATTSDNKFINKIEEYSTVSAVINRSTDIDFRVVVTLPVIPNQLVTKNLKSATAASLVDFDAEKIQVAMLKPEYTEQNVEISTNEDMEATISSMFELSPNKGKCKESVSTIRKERLNGNSYVIEKKFDTLPTIATDGRQRDIVFDSEISLVDKKPICIEEFQLKTHSTRPFTNLHAQDAQSSIDKQINLEKSEEYSIRNHINCNRNSTEKDSPESWKAAKIIPPTPESHSLKLKSSLKISANKTGTIKSFIKEKEGNDVIHHHSIFVKDTSKYWYKPSISREEAINMLRDKPPGTFVVRDSNSFPGAFGLALKVATPPPGVHPGDGTELVRHFLIEPSPKGVKLKGCNNEPVFGSLSALVYQHSITPLALPTKLLLPEYDPASTSEHVNAAQALLQQGAACNVTFIASLDTESLTGPEAVRRCISEAFNLHKQGMLQPVSVHFKVSAQGVTITDNTRRIFFRRHYPVHSVTFAGIDPSDRKWDNSSANDGHSNYVRHARIFAFVARKLSSRSDNACHIFSELEPEQPASAVVNFITKVMMTKCITGIAY